MAPPNDTFKSNTNGLPLENPAGIFHLSDGKFNIKGVTILSEVPSNVTFTPFSSVPRFSDAPGNILRRVNSNSQYGGFFGFSKEQPSDRLTNSLGKINGRDFLSVFRFKTWWSTMWVGNSGSDLQMETQWVLLNLHEINSYAIIIPIIEGNFRSCLEPGINGQILISAESGSSMVKSSSFNSIAYIHISENPYNLMRNAYSALRVHLNSFKLLEEKSVPSIVDKFGWCTWDAFYLAVEPAGIFQGIKDFSDGGFSPRFLIIDDGWQSINSDGEDPNHDSKNLVLGGTQMTSRLHKLVECEKFRKYKGGSLVGCSKDPIFDPKKPKLLISKAIEIERAEKDYEKAKKSGIGSDLSELELKIEKLEKELSEIFGEEKEEDGVLRCSSMADNGGLKAFTSDLRKRFKGLDDIYVWHALCGAWGGVRPGSTHLNSKVIPSKLSPGLDGTMEDLAVVKLVEGGIGLVHPNQAHDFYDSMHSYLADVGITGVKVDVIHSLEYVCEEYGGRVELAKVYYEGLTDSLVKNFNGNGLISSMQQCNDFFFLGTRQISLGRVGDDFWFQDPNGDPMGVYWLQGVHMIHCAYNSMWIGQFIQPDWDMFQSDHLCAKFHAGSRAICGGPIYLSDSVGGHDFNLIKQLVFPDGTIPKCQDFALPTRDCLFKNPLFDKQTILKIWNFNKFNGVIGAFNCQGAGWDPKEKRIRGYSECYQPMPCYVHLNDIEWDQNKEGMGFGLDPNEEFLVYLNQAEEIVVMNPTSKAIETIIQPSSFEIFTFVPIKRFGEGLKFAAIGLTNMFNNGGTIQELDYIENGVAEVLVKIKVKGDGKFLAYSTKCPKKCYLNGDEVDSQWLENGKLSLNLPWIENFGGVSHIGFVF